MSSWTPEPWEWQLAPHGYDVFKRDPEWPGDTEGGFQIAFVEEEQDARVIAKAPEMAALLQRLVGASLEDMGQPGWVENYAEATREARALLRELEEQP